MLRSLRAQIKQISGQVRGSYGQGLMLVSIGLGDFSEDGDGTAECAGFEWSYAIDGQYIRLFVPGSLEQASSVAGALADHAHKVSRISPIRPGVVLMQAETAPDDAVLIQPTPLGFTLDEYAAQVYDLLRNES